MRRVYEIRKYGFFLLVILAQCTILFGGWQGIETHGQELIINWDKLKELLKVYESCPNEENAQRLLDMIPENLASRQLGNISYFVLAFFESLNFEKAVIAGDDRLAEVAFRLLGYFGGGAVDEELRIMLGRFLTKKPAQFLRLLKKYEHMFSSESEYPVNMTEILDIVPDITSEEDLIHMKKEEMRLYMERIKALESVTDPELIEMRDACIRVIKGILIGLEKRACKRTYEKSAIIIL